MSDPEGIVRLTLKDLPVKDRPQERLEKYGPRPLSDRELLAMLLRSGTARHDVLALADIIIKEAGSLAGLVRWDVSDFQKVPGVGKVKALQLSVHLEIAQRIAQGSRLKKLELDEPVKVWNLLYPEAISESVEKVWVLCLDRKNRVLRKEVITSGTATGCLVHPREVFRPAIRWGATAVILAHNHPSGDPSPSTSDLQVTRKIAEASKHLDLEFIDHVIIGEPSICPSGCGYYSFSDNGLV
ncbi:MAG: DNA repair protein RadC [Opitutae bacterium]